MARKAKLRKSNYLTSSLKSLSTVILTIITISFTNCGRQIENPTRLGKFICNCYSEQIPSLGPRKGDSICNVMAANKSRLYAIYLVEHVGYKFQGLQYDSSEIDAALKFAARVNSYIEKNCIGYFFKQKDF